MPKVLIVAGADLTPELGRTVLWRSDIERVFAPDREAGFEAARMLRPSLVILDDTDGRATVSFICRLRADPVVQRLSVAVLSRSQSLSLAEEEAFRRAGANLVLSGEVDPLLWDDRLEELLSVPRRREVRVPVRLEVWSRLAADHPVEGLSLNISVRGMLLETAEPLDVGTKLDLGFRLPGESQELRVVGQVVREAEPVEERPRSGIEFLILRGGARERIREFVEAETRH